MFMFIHVWMSDWARETENERKKWFTFLSMEKKWQMRKKKKTMTNLQSPPYDYLNHNVHEQVALHLKK